MVVNFQLTAYHESGHAIVALNTDGAHPIHKATIMPRGSALGMVTQLPSSDETSISRKQLLARLDVCMGGRVAEELIFGRDNVTTGASSDLQSATELAQYMVLFRSPVLLIVQLWHLLVLYKSYSKFYFCIFLLLMLLLGILKSSNLNSGHFLVSAEIHCLCLLYFNLSQGIKLWDE
jgi:hypothetical protein